MELFKMMQNIRGINIEEEIKQAIKEQIAELKNLTINQTCAIYSSHLFLNMRKRHLNVRLINTEELGLNFRHYFVLIKGNDNFYIADLTFNQFNINNFIFLKQNGYMIIDDNNLNKYLSYIERKEITSFTCDNLFYQENVQKR